MKHVAATSPSVPAAGLSLIFFLSGAAALIFEALWFHQAGLALGNSVWASSLVLAGFMGGLALGNGLVGRWGYRLHRPLRAYALVEVAVGAAGLGLIYLLPAMTPLLAPLLGPLLDQPLLINSLRLGVAFLLLLVPATAMGATLPLVVAAMFRSDTNFGRVLGRLYGWNTLGAVAGVLAVEAVLLPSLGVRGAGWVAAGLDLMAAGGAFLLATRSAGEETGHLPAAGVPGRPVSRSGYLLLAAAFTGGAILLALEVVWFRFLQLFVLGTGLAFAIMLAAVLAGIALGGLAGGSWLARSPSAVRHTGVVALGGGVAVVGAYAAMAPLVASFEGQMLQSWSQVTTLALPLMLPVALLSGLLFTLLGSALHQEIRSGSRAAGYLTLANTTGAMLGAALAGLLLLPLLGVEQAMRGLAAGYGVVALCILLAGTAGGAPAVVLRRPLMAVAGLAFLVSLVIFPVGFMADRFLAYPISFFQQSEGARVVTVDEGLTETVILMDVEKFHETLYHRLVTNAYSMSATTYPSRRYMSLFAYLPMVFQPEPREALLISYGVGVTAGALVRQESLQGIDVVDISRDILEMSDLIYPGPGENPLDDPRVRVHVEDGRFFLQTTDRLFDIITGEPPPPRVAGVINLYTREYFDLVHRRLRAGGMATYWLPVHSLHPDEARAIMAAFCAAFDDCSLWSGAGWDWILAGSKAASSGLEEGAASTPAMNLTASAFSRPWRDPGVAPMLGEIAVERPEQLGALFLGDAATLAAWIQGVDAFNDDEPRRLLTWEPSLEEVYAAYRPWSEAAAARDRFLASDWIRRIWPTEMRSASVPYFAAQAQLNALMYGEVPGLPVTLPQVHDLLAGTDLTTLPLLLLGSDPLVMATVDEALAAGGEQVGLAARQGLRALARRDTGSAVSHLAAAWGEGDTRASVAWAFLYALCVNGQTVEAAEFAQLSGLAADTSPGGRQALAFLQTRFGLRY